MRTVTSSDAGSEDSTSCRSGSSPTRESPRATDAGPRGEPVALLRRPTRSILFRRGPRSPPQRRSRQVRSGRVDLFARSSAEASATCTITAERPTLFQRGAERFNELVRQLAHEPTVSVSVADARSQLQAAVVGRACEQLIGHEHVRARQGIQQRDFPAFVYPDGDLRTPDRSRCERFTSRVRVRSSGSFVACDPALDVLTVDLEFVSPGPACRSRRRGATSPRPPRSLGTR